MEPKFMMMVGLPGSGKSYLAAKIAGDDENTIILSSDKIRGELFGDENSQADNAKVFEELHRRALVLLKDGYNVIYDATNLNSKRRMSFLKTIDSAGISCHKTCYLMAFEYCYCLKRNAERDRFVPTKVINSMREKFQTPYYFEGWDEIIVVREEDAWRYPVDCVFDLLDYDQCNSHHKETLGNHLKTTYLAVAEKTSDKDVWIAALLHDVGKPFVRNMANAKGEQTDDAHYYGHENVGAYQALFYKADDPLYVSLLVNLHMRPFTLKSPASQEKYRKLWGEKVYNDVMLIHEADTKGGRDD